MIDGVPLENGQSRAMRATLPATYEEFVQACANGTQLLDIMFNAAGWQTLPTFLNKANLLQDPTAAQYGLGSTATVDDVLSDIANRLALISGNMASITATIQDTAGNPLQGVLVSGVFDDSGNTVQTNTSGVASGYIAEGQTTVAITGYADIQNFSTVLTVVKGSSYTETFTVTTRNFLKVLSTQFLKFSGNVNQVDETAVGGGGGSGRGTNDRTQNHAAASGGAGAGGQVVVSENVPFVTNTLYQVIVGAGGTPAVKGGSSSALGITAEGGNPGGDASQISDTGVPGQGGIGPNGNGANGVADSGSGRADGLNGGPGTVEGYDSFTTTTLYGGGGGSGSIGAGSPGSGANTAGAGGDDTNGYNGHPGQDGFGSGAGSGGADPGRYGRYGAGANGGSGCVAFRMHLKSAA